MRQVLAPHSDIRVSWPSSLTPADKAALVIAHPGHELRAFGWLGLVRPCVYVLTDGSGHGPVGRLNETAQVLRHAGASAGDIFGELTDRKLYELILARDWTPFAELADRLVEGMLQNEVQYIVCDAAEGYNTGHEACRLLAAAVAREVGMPLFELALVGAPRAKELHHSVRLRLGPAALAEKLAVARSYKSLAHEVQKVLNESGPKSLAVECLQFADAAAAPGEVLPRDPYYERHGIRQVAAGHYGQVIRRAEHLLPLARFLQARAGRLVA